MGHKSHKCNEGTEQIHEKSHDKLGIYVVSKIGTMDRLSREAARTRPWEGRFSKHLMDSQFMTTNSIVSTSRPDRTVKRKIFQSDEAFTK